MGEGNVVTIHEFGFKKLKSNYKIYPQSAL